MGRDPLVQAIGIWRRFGSREVGTNALQDVSCAIYPGDSIALTGPSGSGKSTLLHLLGGIDTPTCGEVSWPTLGHRNQLRPAKISIVFQGPSLLAPLSVVENVRLPLILADTPEDQAHALADRALERLNLEDIRDKLPEEISGGQAQRVAIARALATSPALFLADEPTGQLDSTTAEEVIAILLTELREMGAATLVATHDPRVARHFEASWEMARGRLHTGVPCST